MKEDHPSLVAPMAIFPKWFYQDFFKKTIATLLVLLIIFLFYQVTFLLQPVLDFISILFTPIIISFLLYYLLRPLVQLCERIHIPRSIAIIAIYIVGAIWIVLTAAYVVPLLADQIRAIADTSVETLERVKENSKSIVSRFFGFNLNQEIEQRLLSFLQQATALLSRNILDMIGWITRLAAILAVTPFIVFYLLKDDHTFAELFVRSFPNQFTNEVKKIIKHVDSTLSTYINGLVLVSLSIGVLLFFGYLLIGLNYALILSLLSVILTTIPFLGPFLAIIPALLVGLSQGTWMTLKVAIVFIVIQQLESNVVSPQIIGQRLNIHPLTIILLLLAAGSVYGLLGLLLATPVYAISKVIIANLYKIYRLRYPSNNHLNHATSERP